MRTLNSIIFLLVSLLFLTITSGCNRNKEKTSVIAKRINVNISNTPIKISSVFSDPELLSLEKGDLPLGKISKVKIYNDTIYILSNYRIFIYSITGNYVRMLNRKGKGPGEYNNLFDFVVDESGNIDILDFSGKKIIKYDSKGNYIDEWKTGMYAFAFIRINDYYILFGGNGNPATSYSEKMLYVFDKWEGRVIKEYIPVDHNIENFANYIDSRNIQPTPDGFYLGFSPYDTIYHFTNGQIDPALIIDFGKHKIGRQIYSNKFPDIMAFNEYLNDNNLCHFICNYLVTPELALFNFFYKNSYWAGVYDLNSDEVATSDVFEDDLLFKGNEYKTSSFFPVEFKNGYYYFIVESYCITNYIKDYGIEAVGKINFDKEKLQKIRIEDNPLLLKLKFKNE